MLTVVVAGVRQEALNSLWGYDAARGAALYLPPSWIRKLNLNGYINSKLWFKSNKLVWKAFILIFIYFNHEGILYYNNKGWIKISYYCFVYCIFCFFECKYIFNAMILMNWNHTIIITHDYIFFIKFLPRQVDVYNRRV